MSAGQEKVDTAIDRIAAAGAAGPGADWARRAAGLLLLADVRGERIVEAVTEVADEVERSGETPQELFGTPEDFVRDVRARWRETGVEQHAPERLTARDLTVETLAIACGFGALFSFVNLLDWSVHEPFTLSRLLAPLALAVASRAVGATWSVARVRRSHRAGMIAAGAVLAVSVALTVALFAVGNDVVVGSNALLGFVGATLAYGVLAWLVARAWSVPPETAARPGPARGARGPVGPGPDDAAPDGPESDGTALGDAAVGDSAADDAALGAEPLDDEAWLEALGRALRGRDDMGDARVAEIQAEARDHARDAGTSLAREFGAPAAYADRFPEERGARARWRAWFASGLAGGVLVYNVVAYLEGTASVWGALWLALTAGCAVVEWRHARRTGRA